MNKFTNVKKTNKFIIVLVLLILFNFCCPKNIQAGLDDDIKDALLDLGRDILAAPAKILWMLEEGLLRFVNNIFTGEENDADDALEIALTPESIIKGKFMIFDANIFKDVANEDYLDFNLIKDGRNSLRNVIAGWYYALRNFAIIALLTVLVYVGIRMILSTMAQDKSKYKAMFKDWLVALCLVVVMHYIIIAILNTSELICKALSPAGKNSTMLQVLVSDITKILADSDYSVDGMDLKSAYAKIIVVAGVMLYTVIFAVKYLIREFTIIFLILLGPVSCITYPIDKISDGKSQAFNKWFSEFLYNVIIQPFHLLIYIVLVGSASELADTNVIYALVCFAVMIPAEKFIKAMFGFNDSLGSPLGAFATGALASKLLGKGGSGGSNSNSNSNSTPELPPRTSDNAGDLVEGNTTGGASSSSNNIDGNDYIDGDESATPQLDEGSGGIDTADNTLDMEDGAEENLGDGNVTEDNEESEPFINPSQDSTNTPNNRNIKNKPRGVVERVLAGHNKRAAKKWGSSRTLKRWANRGKKALRVGTGIAAGTLAFMGGHGIQGVVTGFAAGRTLSGRVFDGTANAINSVRERVNDIRSDITGREPSEAIAQRNFMDDQNQIDKAILSYRDRNGEIPRRTELQQELRDRYNLSRYGLSDTQIDDCMPMYREKMDELLASGKSNEEAQRIAASQAKYTAGLAGAYSAKDFRDSKVMKAAHERITKGLMEQTGCSADVADKYARQYLKDAAKMKSVSAHELALPTNRQTVDVQVPNVLPALGVENSGIESAELNRMNEMTIRLHQQGYTKEEIENIARSCADSRIDAAHVVENYNAKVEFLTDEKALSEAKEYIGKEATNKEMKVEMENRFQILSAGAERENLTAIRSVEDELYKNHNITDKQRALNIAKKVDKVDWKNVNKMDKLIKDTAKNLKDDGRVTTGDGMKLATEIVERAAMYKGINNVAYTVKN